jgi:hypothetical protein
VSNLTIIRGDDATFDVDITADGAELPIEDALAVTFTAKRSAVDDDVDALIRKDLDYGITIDGNAAHVAIEAADTRDLAAPMALLWDLEVVDADGLTHTVAVGYLRIEADVTRESGFVAGSGS